MPLRDDDVVGAVDHLFVSTCTQATVHPRSVQIGQSARNLAVYVEQFHADTGVPIPDFVQEWLDWALDPDRDPDSGQKGNRP